MVALALLLVLRQLTAPASIDRSQSELRWTVGAHFSVEPAA
jgi:hypothetical protein